MKLCVVGNGPSAEGMGREIDAYDYVVRIKSYWQNGAEDAGSKCDAHCHYGWGDWSNKPEGEPEHWMSQTVEQISATKIGWIKSEFVVEAAGMRPMRWITKALWQNAYEYLGFHPSTGFVAVLMAIDAMHPTELGLYGFDSTTTDKPDFWDARGVPVDYRGIPLSQCPRWRPPHNHEREKAAFAEIECGVWMGQPTNIKLIWPNRPEITWTRFANDTDGSTLE